MLQYDVQGGGGGSSELRARRRERGEESNQTDGVRRNVFVALPHSREFPPRRELHEFDDALELGA